MAGATAAKGKQRDQLQVRTFFFFVRALFVSRDFSLSLCSVCVAALCSPTKTELLQATSVNIR